MSGNRIHDNMSFEEKVIALCNGHKPAETIVRSVCCKGRKIDQEPLHTLDEMGFYEHFIEVLHNKCCCEESVPVGSITEDSVKEFGRFLYLRSLGKISDEKIVRLLQGDEPIDPGLLAWEDRTSK